MRLLEVREELKGGEVDGFLKVVLWDHFPPN
jgi:hypothetical protein